VILRRNVQPVLDRKYTAMVTRGWLKSKWPWIAIAAYLTAAVVAWVALRMRNSDIHNVGTERILAERSRPRFGPNESQPITGTHAGRTREAIVAELGRPSSEWVGHYGLPSASYRLRHKGAKVLYYHWQSGDFYASIEEVNGRWICFSSDWLPEGWVID
jgi:hypothetical protein